MKAEAMIEEIDLRLKWCKTSWIKYKILTTKIQARAPVDQALSAGFPERNKEEDSWSSYKRKIRVTLLYKFLIPVLSQT